jgi:hypothetical protein
MGFDVQAARNFLLRLYDPALGLFRASPNAEPTTYWLNNDNYLAAKVFAGHQIGTTVQDNLASKKAGTARISVLDGEILSNILVANEVRLIDKLGEKEVKTEATPLSGHILPINSYADIAFYNALNLFNQGEVTDAKAAFETAERRFWDKCGFRDTTFNGLYQLYKNCLYLITADRLGVNAVFRTACEARVVSAQSHAIDRIDFQNQRGGCLSEYDSAYVPTGDTNTETTCLAIRCFMPF